MGKTVSLDRLNELFAYDRDEGGLFWKPRPISHFKNDAVCASWNGKLAGKRAGTISPEGYRKIGIDGSYYAEHRLIWFIETGCWPDEIDHKNGNRGENKFGNLRDVTHAENMRNKALHKTNKSGHPGVVWEKAKGLWCARIPVDGKLKTLGRSKEKSVAIAIRVKAERELHYSEIHGRAA